MVETSLQLVHQATLVKLIRFHTAATAAAFVMVWGTSQLARYKGFPSGFVGASIFGTLVMLAAAVLGHMWMRKPNSVPIYLTYFVVDIIAAVFSGIISLLSVIQVYRVMEGLESVCSWITGVHAIFGIMTFLDMIICITASALICANFKNNDVERMKQYQPMVVITEKAWKEAEAKGKGFVVISPGTQNEDLNQQFPPPYEATH